MNNSLGTREKPGCLRSYIIIGQSDSGGKREREGGFDSQAEKDAAEHPRQAGRRAGGQTGRRKCWKKKKKKNRTA